MELLSDLIIILFVAAIILFISAKLNIPSVVGLLISGIIVGPAGLGLIQAVNEVEVVAEIGILFLLFTIGIEFSLDKLLKSKRWILIGGSLQVFLTILVVSLLAWFAKVEFYASLFIGMLFSMSSTAIVLQLFQEKGWMDTPFGNASVAVLIFQDIIIIPLILMVPFLASTSHDFVGGLLPILRGFLIVGIALFFARKVIPRVLSSIVHTRNQDLFLISILVICFATAFVTNLLGLKLALGAFLAGLVISESEYSIDALKNILPLKKIFTGIFFVSVGMLLNLDFFGQQVIVILGIILGIIVLKSLVVFLIGLLLNLRWKDAIIAGLSLSQVGEFAFVLSKTGLDFQIIEDQTYQIFLAVSIGSMILTSFLIQHAPVIADWWCKLPFVPTGVRNREEQYICGPENCNLKDHIVVIGYGPSGHRIVDGLKQKKLPYAIIEKSEKTVDKYRVDGEQILSGDATQIDVLKRGNTDKAKIVIITVPEAATAEEITKTVRTINQKAHIIVRTRHVEETGVLKNLGADWIIPVEIAAADMISDRITQLT